MKRYVDQTTSTPGPLATRDVPRAMADLLEVSGVVDRACKETPRPPSQFVEASRAIHRALLALYDWSSRGSQPTVSATATRNQSS